MAFLPADRHRQSGVPKATLLENVAMTNGSRFVRNGWLRHGAEKDAVSDVLSGLTCGPMNRTGCLPR